jgi:3-hydroxy-9,10-secoandrosta-1,3,5(10)-triene-9,17-dione monooxygenase reductase component
MEDLGPSARAFREANSRFATGVAIVTALRQGGLPVGVTVSSYTSVSLDPPLVLVCLHRHCRVLEWIRRGGCFGVNILSAEQRELSARFASSIAERFESLLWYGGRTGVPLLPDALATIECELSSAVPGGDHEILIGRVVHLAVAEGDPLVRYRSAYRQLDTVWPAPDRTPQPRATAQPFMP